MESFRFKAGDSPQPTLPTARRSTRLSASISTEFKSTKVNVNCVSPTSKTRKRKADGPVETPTPGGSSVSTIHDPTRARPLPAPLLDSSTGTEAEAEAEAEAASSPSTLTPGPTSNNNNQTNNSKKKKRKRPTSGYAPPSVYAHLPFLPDALAPNLLVLFCGLNPGIRTAQTGHAYSHPSNRFWKLMHSSGVLPVPCTADEDRTLPARFRLGLTNIVARPSRNGAELSKAEMDEGVGVLEGKVRRWRPEVVCVVGKSIWESVWRVRHGGRAVGTDFAYGWQEDKENMGSGGVREEEKREGVAYRENWQGARVFVASSTSGLAATPRPEEKERIWRELGVWVERRRAERKAEEAVS